MKEIPLTQGMVALVDDEDYEWINQYKWYVNRAGVNIYAVRYDRGRGRGEAIKMHQQIMRAKETDHRDNNGLNNQRSNLRHCNRSQNCQNRRKAGNCSSKYKGVSFRRKATMNPWVVSIRTVGRKFVYIGVFATEVEAALAYNNKAVELFGEFARINIIKEVEIGDKSQI